LYHFQCSLGPPSSLIAAAAVVAAAAAAAPLPRPAQVTNRDLSVAVLRRFLPQLAQEKAEGKIRKPGQNQKDKKAKKDAKAKGEAPQPAQVGTQGRAA
jgi:hypothetical protein